MKYAIAPEGTECVYITAGKRYAVIKVSGGGFYTISDNGEEMFCLYTGCAHLDGKDWLIVDDMASAPTVPDIAALTKIKGLTNGV